MINIVDLHNEIPGYLSGIQPAILYLLFSKYNKPDTIGVEIGCLHGRSSATIAYAINQGKLYCIDPWPGSPTRALGVDLEKAKSLRYPDHTMYNTLDVFLKNTSAYTNIVPIKGHSPSVIQDWSIPVDFVFLDASHCNPNDRENIDFWLPKIKKGGTFAGHDYHENFPDVIENVSYIESVLGQEAKLYGNTTIWSFDIT